MELCLAPCIVILRLVVTAEQVGVLDSDGDDQRFESILTAFWVLKGCEQEWQERRLSFRQGQAVAVEALSQFFFADQYSKEVRLFEDASHGHH